MPRRLQYQENGENSHRWVVSYADLMTLMFAFFVVMYALSSVNEEKYKELAASLTGAFIQTG
ncbi:MAG: flagellar motor protein MotB, partial [Pontibacterium sp.]